MSIRVVWRPRDAPLEPVGVVATGGAARALGARVLARDDAALAHFQGVTAGRTLVLLGEATDLPWADGVIYIGRDERAPALLCPTVLEPGVPIALFERALVRRFADAGTPLVVWPAVRKVIPCADARAVSRKRLAAWLEASS